MSWKYSATEIISIMVFICFCIGILSIMTGLLTVAISIFLVNVKLSEIGLTAVFYGLATVFICAGIGCFIPPKDRVLIQ